MSLKDIEKKLYSGDEYSPGKKEKNLDFGEIDIPENKDEAREKFTPKKKWWQVKFLSGLTNEARKAVYIGAVVFGIILFGALLVVGIYKFKQTAFAEDKIAIFVSGKNVVNSSETVKYIVKYENKNRIKLKNVEIILNYPENFYPNEDGKFQRVSDRSGKVVIGDLKAHSSGQVEIEGKFYAPENYTAYLKATIKYMPANFHSFFQLSNQIAVNVATSPLKLEVLGPKEALSDTIINYEIKYENKSDVDLNDLNLKIVYPDGFEFQEADSEPVEKNDNEYLWHLGDLMAEKKGEVRIKGMIKGKKFDTKLMKAVIYKNGNNDKEIIYGKGEGLTKIVVPPLSISHKVNGKSFLNANLGEVLRYQIHYANDGEIGLRDVVIRLKIDSPLIDYPELKLKNGAFRNNTKTIVWKASDIPDLKNLLPRMSGTISLDIPLKKDIKIKNPDDKNFVLKSVVSIDSSDKAFESLLHNKNISNEVTVKLNSRVTVDYNAYYTDNVIKNSGPIPPKVGELTTYTIHWKVSNLSNDISGTKIRAFLPTEIKWMNKVVCPDGRVEFNERTNEVIWNIGKILAGTGYLSPAKECVFQVGLTPEANQVNKSVNLLMKSTLNATDDFTKDNVYVETGVLTTRLKNDKNVGDDGSQVVQ